MGSADQAAMATAAEQVEAKHHQIHQLQTHLESRMANLQSRWHGNASAQFQRGYSYFDTELEKIKQGLELIHTALMEDQLAGRHHLKSQGSPAASSGGTT